MLRCLIGNATKMDVVPAILKGICLGIIAAVLFTGIAYLTGLYLIKTLTYPPEALNEVNFFQLFVTSASIFGPAMVLICGYTVLRKKNSTRLL